MLKRSNGSFWRDEFGALTNWGSEFEEQNCDLHRDWLRINFRLPNRIYSEFSIRKGNALFHFRMMNCRLHGVGSMRFTLKRRLLNDFRHEPLPIRMETTFVATFKASVQTQYPVIAFFDTRELICSFPTHDCSSTLLVLLWE